MSEQRIVQRYLSTYNESLLDDDFVLCDTYIIQLRYEYEVAYSHYERRYVILRTNNPAYFPPQ